MDITLSVTRKDTSEAKAREVGRLMQVHVSPIYDRPVIELIPIAFGIYAKRVPQFSLRNNVIAREEGDEFRFRAGTMMVANMVPFHPDQSVSLGVGVGFGFFGEGKPLSDFLVGSLVSYRDLFRVGLGFGLSELPNSLKRPAAEGDPLPSNAGNITDVVETKKRGAIFMLFNMTGLSVPLLK